MQFSVIDDKCKDPSRRQQGFWMSVRQRRDIQSKLSWVEWFKKEIKVQKCRHVDIEFLFLNNSRQ